MSERSGVTAHTFDDDVLARVLASVGRHLDTDGDATTAALPVRRVRRRALAVAAVLVIALLLVAAIPPARRAVADWLGIGSTTVVHVPADGAPIVHPPITSGLTPIDAAEAERRLGRPLPDTTSSQLGAPQALLAMPEGGVLMVWAEGASTLWVHDADMPAGVLVKKLIGSEQQARWVDGVGDGVVAVTGDHVLVTPHRTIAAGTVLLWTDGPTEYRLESDLPLDVMITVARELR
ncbi:MAG: hypothetical protein QM733_21100 [Ilumatobacteraceae bacterium]